MKPNISSKNAYEILGVPRTADVPAIRKAFRVLAIQHHPDARPPDEKKSAAEVFARINQAHEVLRDSEKRRRYDALLDRGQTPELGQDLAEQGRFASLGDIVGEVQSLGLSAESDALIAQIGEDLREKMLKPMLIRGDRFNESAADVLSFTFAENGDSQADATDRRDFAGGVLVVTELRLILLLTYVHTWQVGNVQHTRTTWRSYAIPYGAVQDLLIHEVGRAYKSYRLEIKEQEGRRFEMIVGTEGALAYKPSRLSRLLLVANIHKLPLRIVAEGAAGAEYEQAVGMSLIPGALWIAPFIISTLCQMCDRQGGQDPECAKHYPAIGGFMNEYFITTLVVYSVPALCAFLVLKVFSKWALRRPEQLFGELAVDYASAPPAITEETLPAQPATTEPTSQPKAESVKRTSDAPPLPSPSAAPVAVALPDSIQDAFGEPDTPPPPPPSPASPPPISATPQPAPKSTVAPLLVPCPDCGHPNRVAGGGLSRCEECGAAIP